MKYQVLVTKRTQQGTQSQQRFNPVNLAAAVATMNDQSRKADAVRVELSVILETWSKSDA